ncbi:hypothetical protein HHI36_002182 [Cryptolaemus montrouzieri]|uniref:Uncharacterized protein n=1 Tax=Cryptolaemus montrouzieri TaxID=559131 RepID=A0ABD2P9R7_9CUCU
MNGSDDDVEDDWDEEDDLKFEDSSIGISEPENNGIVLAEEYNPKEGHRNTPNRDLDQLSDDPSVGDGNSSDDNVPMARLPPARKRMRYVIKPKCSILRGKNEYFLHFICDDIEHKILRCTNYKTIKQSSKYADDSPTISAVTKEELMSLQGILIM